MRGELPIKARSRRPSSGARMDQALAAERSTARVACDRQSTSTATSTLTRVRAWNLIANTAVAIDHTPPQAGETRAFGENAGPARTARALAIVHVALFEAANAVAGGYRSYLGLARDSGASIDAAIAQASHDALVATYRAQKRALRQGARDRSRLDPERHRQDARHRARPARGSSDPGAQGRRWIAAPRAASGHRLHPAIGSWLLVAGSGQSGSRSRWARSGRRWTRS